MKKLFIALIMISSILIPSANQIEATSHNLTSNPSLTSENQSEDTTVVELSKEEFVKQVATRKGISTTQAEQEIDRVDFQNLVNSFSMGRRMPKSLYLKYGYFQRQHCSGDGMICATYGVYASYYLPDSNSPWSSRYFNGVHDSYLYASNFAALVKLYSKSAFISNSYTIVFAANFDMKRDAPFNWYVNYKINTNFGL